MELNGRYAEVEADCYGSLLDIGLCVEGNLLEVEVDTSPKAPISCASGSAC